MPLFRHQAMAALRRPKLFLILSLVLALGFGWYCMANGFGLLVFLSTVTLYVIIAGVLLSIGWWMSKGKGHKKGNGRKND